MTNEIKLTALLIQAAMLLREARVARAYQIKSLTQTPEEASKKKPLDESTKAWLLEKAAREIADIDDLLCNVDKLCFSDKCTIPENEAKTQELDERSKKAIAYLLGKPAILDKLIGLAEQQEINFNHDNVKHPSTD